MIFILRGCVLAGCAGAVHERGLSCLDARRIRCSGPLCEVCEEFRRALPCIFAPPGRDKLSSWPPAPTVESVSSEDSG